LFPTLSNNYIPVFPFFLVYDENSTETCYDMAIIPYNTLCRAKKPAANLKKNREKLSQEHHDLAPVKS